MVTDSASPPARWTPSFSPRDWQEEAITAWRSGRRGVVSVVTGGGKTAFAQLCMAEVQEAVERVIIIVPTLALVDQWYVSLVEDLGVAPGEITTYSGRPWPSDPGRVVLMVLNTAREAAPLLAAEGPGKQMLIVDECHRAGAPTNALALRGDYAATLGLSATPIREFDSGFEDYVAPALGEVIYEYSYADALEDEVITPFRLRNVRVPLAPDEDEEVQRLSRAIGRRLGVTGGVPPSHDERLQRLLLARARVVNSARSRLPVAVRLALDHRGSRTIVFHETIAGANAIAAGIEAQGISVAVYHSGISESFRRESLRLYRRGRFDVLVTCRALDEGMNAPETTVGIIASGTASTRQRIQRLGRILRPAEGKSEAVIYTLYASDQEEERLLAEATDDSLCASVDWLQSGPVA